MSPNHNNGGLHGCTGNVLPPTGHRGQAIRGGSNRSVRKGRVRGGCEPLAPAGGTGSGGSFAGGGGASGTRGARATGRWGGRGLRAATPAAGQGTGYQFGRGGVWAGGPLPSRPGGTGRPPPRSRCRSPPASGAT